MADCFRDGLCLFSTSGLLASQDPQSAVAVYVGILSGTHWKNQLMAKLWKNQPRIKWFVSWAMLSPQLTMVKLNSELGWIRSQWHRDVLFINNQLERSTLPKTNIVPETRPSQKESTFPTTVLGF